jgi:predicted phage tail protein
VVAVSASNFEIDSNRKRFGSVTVIKVDNKISVQLYETVVVKKSGRTTVTLNSGGWRTVATKHAMNRALRQMFERAPFVRQTKKVWYVDFPNGKTLEFRDGITFRVSREISTKGDE